MAATPQQIRDVIDKFDGELDLDLPISIQADGLYDASIGFEIVHHPTGLDKLHLIVRPKAGTLKYQLPTDR